MADFIAKFTLEQQPTIQADFNIEEQDPIDVELSLDVQGITEHNLLDHRDLPDQHPIEAISGLNERLNQIADKNFIFEQGIASDTWQITHNLNKKPSVTVVDTADNVIYPAVQYINDNSCVVTFNAATKGKAYLN